MSAFGNDTTLGRSPLSNIIYQNTSLSPSCDVSLGRSGDIDDASIGTFIVGSHNPQFSTIEQAPMLPQVTDGRWSVLIEGLSVMVNNLAFSIAFASVPSVP